MRTLTILAAIIHVSNSQEESVDVQASPLAECGTTCAAYACFEQLADCDVPGYLDPVQEECQLYSDPDTLRAFSPNAQDWLRCYNHCVLRFTRRYFERHSIISSCSQLVASLNEASPTCHRECALCHVCRDSRLAWMKMHGAKSLTLLAANPLVAAAVQVCGNSTHSGAAACGLPHPPPQLLARMARRRKPVKKVTS